jgi:hypothetical protein
VSFCCSYMPIMGSTKSKWLRRMRRKLLLLPPMGFIATSPCLMVSKMSCPHSFTARTFQDDVPAIIDVYVYDIVVKTRQRSSILLDLAPVFDMLRSTRMMLNPKKCVLGVFGGKLLDFLVSH